MLTQFFDIIVGTPFWVWLIFFYLLYVGFKNLQLHIIYVPKLFIVPLIFLAIQYEVFLSESAPIFFLVLLLSTSLSFLAHIKVPIFAIKESTCIKIPGHYSILLILISFFFVKYFFGYLQDTNPALADKYALLDIIISSALSGFFLGRAICYSYKYLKA